MSLPPSQPDTPVPPLPSVAVTATTEMIRGVLRTRANASYTNAAAAAGLRPYILPLRPAAEADSLLDDIDGLLLTGGEDVSPARYNQSAHASIGEMHDLRDAFELALVQAAHRRRIPTLAICRGIQVANVALGGTLVQDIPSQWPNPIAHDGGGDRSTRIHGVAVTSRSRLAAAVGVENLMVNSFHHQSIERPADGFEVTARAPDGVIEGAEWTGDDWWLLAVQWHPEELIETPESYDRNLFRTFADYVRTTKA